MTRSHPTNSPDLDSHGCFDTDGRMGVAACDEMGFGRYPWELRLAGREGPKHSSSLAERDVTSPLLTATNSGVLAKRGIYLSFAI